jgi:hypothetical protein
MDPGGVAAGVLGIERALLMPPSIDMELPPCDPFMPWFGQLKPSEVAMLPMTLEALVGGVGNVNARSSGGRLVADCEGSDC